MSVSNPITDKDQAKESIDKWDRSGHKNILSDRMKFSNQNIFSQGRTRGRVVEVAHSNLW